MKELLIYSLNYEPELTGIGKYNGEMATAIKSFGYEVTVITAPPYYPEWRKRPDYSYFKFREEIVDGVPVFRCPLYVPKNVTTFARLFHLFTFSISSGFKLLTLLSKKPDVLFLVQPTFFCVPIALLYCRITGSKAIMHIQDFELDAMLGLGMSKSRWFTRLLERIESWFLIRFDLVSTISFSMLERARSKGVDENKLLFFPNWADTEFVTPDTSGETFRAQLGYKKSDKIVLYAGNIGKKQGLEIVLDAAVSLTKQPHIKFLMVGAGAHLDELRENAESLSLDNIRFLPLQRWEDVPAMLAMADVHLVIQKRGAADAVLPSKLTNILAAGGYAIVTAERKTELGQLAEKYPGIYTLIEPENSELLKNAILEIIEGKSTSVGNAVARSYAEQNLNKDAIIKRFIDKINRKLFSHYDF